MKVLIALLVLLALFVALGFWLSRGRIQEAVSAPPMLVGSDSKAAVQEALAPYQAALEATRRPVLKIELQDFPEDDVLASKVGGSAWWPEGEAAPVGQGGDKLYLLAQLNFSEMPASAQYPGKGLLQFFIAADDYYGANFDGDFSAGSLSEQRNFRVLYWPDTSVASTVLPGETDSDFRLPYSPEKPRRMRFTSGDEVLSSSDYRFDALLGGNAYETLDAWAKAKGHNPTILDDVYMSLDGTGHKFGGYPYFTQSDPRTGGRMELLLQLDSDEQMMWGDVGVGGFFIDPADLAKADFSRVMYNWDCH